MHWHSNPGLRRGPLLGIRRAARHVAAERGQTPGCRLEAWRQDAGTCARFGHGVCSEPVQRPQQATDSQFKSLHRRVIQVPPSPTGPQAVLRAHGASPSTLASDLPQDRPVHGESETGRYQVRKKHKNGNAEAPANIQKSLPCPSQLVECQREGRATELQDHSRDALEHAVIRSRPPRPDCPPQRIGQASSSSLGLTQGRDWLAWTIGRQVGDLQAISETVCAAAKTD